MARLKDLAEARGKDELIFDPEMILEKPGFNSRDMESEETQAHIRRMADCIKENGIESFPPITIYQEEGNIYVAQGHCRRRAHIIAKGEGAPIKGICCRVDTLSEEDRVLDQLNSNSGLDLGPLGKAHIIKRLIAFGWTVAEVAKKTGNSATHIDNQMKLANAPTEIKEMVKTGKVAARTATDTIRKEGPAKATETLKAAVQTAESKGKNKATAKHIPRQEKLQEKQEEKPAAPTSWETIGPKLKRMVERFRDAEDIKTLQQLQIDARGLLASFK